MCTHKARSLKSIGSWSMKKDSLLYTYTTIDDRKYDIRWIWHKKIRWKIRMRSRKRRKYDYRVETSLLAVAQAFNRVTH